jgi:hypothetical protein
MLYNNEFLQSFQQWPWYQSSKLAPRIYIFQSSIINTKSMEEEHDKNMDKGRSTLANI